MGKEGLKRQNRIWSIFGYRHSAFTLIELLISIAIIGLLAVLVVIFFLGQLNKGRDSRRKADIQRIQVAIEEFEKDNDCYPTAVVCGSVEQEISPYLKEVPCDPITKNAYYYEPSGPGCPSWYRLYATLQNENDADAIPFIGYQNQNNYYASSPNAPSVEAGTTPSAPPGGSPVGNGSGYWGCINGVCTGLLNRDQCSPNYTTASCGNGCTGPGSSPPCESPQ